MTDLTIDETGDLVFLNGDLKLSNSDEQDCVLLINTAAGAWKQSPTIGVGIQAYLGSSGQTAALRKNIVEQLRLDGFSNIDVQLNDELNGTFTYSLSANRNENNSI